MREENAIKLISSHLNIDQELLLSGKFVQMKIGQNTSKSVFFVITEFCVYIFEINHSQTQSTILSSYSLFDMKGGEVFDRSSISIKFSEQTLIFCGEEICCLMDLIATQLNSLLLPAEKPVLAGQIITASHSLSYLSVLSRLRGKLKKMNRYPPLSFLDEMRQYLNQQPTEFNIETIKDANNYLDMVLDAIEIEPQISRLVFTGNQKINHWNLLSVYFANNRTIKRITISEQVNRAFLDFCAAVSKNSNTILQRIDFIGIVFQAEHIDALDKLIQKHPLVGLSFTGCDIKNSTGTLVSLINTNSATQNLKSLHLTSIPLSHSFEIVKASLSVSYLSLRGCCLELSTIFDALKNSKIITIDLTKSRSTVAFAKDGRLPISLQRLVLNDIEWTSSNMCSLFDMVSEFNGYLSLSLARAIMSDSEWMKFFNYLEYIEETNIVAFSWRNNPIHYKLCRFLLRNKKLLFLSVSGCYVPGDGCLHKLLESHPSIESLDIHGTGGLALGISALSLLRSISRSKTIQRIDLSQNQLGNSLLLPIICLISSNSIKEVLIDHNGLNSVDVIKSISQAIKSRSSQIYVQYPENDTKGIPSYQVKVYQSAFVSPIHKQSKNVAEEEWQTTLKQHYENEIIVEEPTEEDFVTRIRTYSTKRPVQIDVQKLGMRSEEKKVDDNLQVEKSKEITWDITLPDIPQIDNTSLISEIVEKFRMGRIIDRLLFELD